MNLDRRLAELESVYARPPEPTAKELAEREVGFLTWANALGQSVAEVADDRVERRLIAETGGYPLRTRGAFLALPDAEKARMRCRELDALSGLVGVLGVGPGVECWVRTAVELGQRFTAEAGAYAWRSFMAMLRFHRSVLDRHRAERPDWAVAVGWRPEMSDDESMEWEWAAYGADPHALAIFVV